MTKEMSAPQDTICHGRPGMTMAHGLAAVETTFTDGDTMMNSAMSVSASPPPDYGSSFGIHSVPVQLQVFPFAGHRNRNSRGGVLGWENLSLSPFH